MNRPTGTTWRNWKKARSRQRERAGLPKNPQDWDAEWKEHGGKIVPPVLPSPDLEAEELIAHRIRKFEKKAAYENARRLIPVQIPVEGPYGIIHFGDPHVDDDGCDWGQLRRDIALVQQTEGLYAANVGDTRNNWVGRLARLFGQQSTSAKEALILAQWFIAQLEGKWAYIIGGNHDAWSGDDDPLEFIAGQVHALYEPSEARMALTSPGGQVVTVNARHDFAGGSMWNPVHAVSKAAQLGVRDDILICGHKHMSGYGVVKSPDDGQVMTNTAVLLGAAPTVAANQLGLGRTTATTVGASGAASALPANPLGYLIANLGGTAIKIPYYNN